MKKLIVILVLLLICSTFCSCSSEYRVDVEGVESFDRKEGYVEINAHLLPTEGFFEMFPYISAQYNHKELFKHRLSVVATECSLIVVNYTSDTYIQAKSCCLQGMELINSFEYNGYTFAENILLARGQNRVRNDNTIVTPELFNMFAYNDQRCCLVFIGAYILDGIEDNTKTDAEAWDEFLQLYFSEFYTF